MERRAAQARYPPVGNLWGFCAARGAAGKCTPCSASSGQTRAQEKKKKKNPKGDLRDSRGRPLLLLCFCNEVFLLLSAFCAFLSSPCSFSALLFKMSLLIYLRSRRCLLLKVLFLLAPRYSHVTGTKEHLGSQEDACWRSLYARPHTCIKKKHRFHLSLSVCLRLSLLFVSPRLCDTHTHLCNPSPERPPPFPKPSSVLMCWCVWHTPPSLLVSPITSLLFPLFFLSLSSL